MGPQQTTRLPPPVPLPPAPMSEPGRGEPDLRSARLPWDMPLYTTGVGVVSLGVGVAVALVLGWGPPWVHWSTIVVAIPSAGLLGLALAFVDQRCPGLGRPVRWSLAIAPLPSFTYLAAWALMGPGKVPWHYASRAALTDAGFALVLALMFGAGLGLVARSPKGVGDLQWCPAIYSGLVTGMFWLFFGSMLCAGPGSCTIHLSSGFYLTEGEALAIPVFGLLLGLVMGHRLCTAAGVGEVAR